MPESTFHVRRLETPDEFEQYFLMAAQAFTRGEDPQAAAARWREYSRNAPDFSPETYRGVFRGGRLVGGYAMRGRRLYLRGAWFLTGCIGALVTHPDYRRQGVARHILQDALERAQDRRLALLLLDGIANFYARFGYADVIDLCDHAVRRSDVLAQPPSPYAVRAATPEDAAVLLELYRQHHGLRPGGFERTLEGQRYALSMRPPGSGPWLALDGQGRARGYLYANRPPQHWQASEVAADDWPAVLALLQFQAGWFDGAEPPQAELCWRAPLDSRAYLNLAAHLTSTAPFPGDVAESWSVRTMLYSRPDCDWLARPANLAALFETLLPACLARRPDWPASLAFSIDAAPPVALPLAPASPARHDVRLSAGAFTQLLFGYRSVDWLQALPAQDVPRPAAPLLEALFPPAPGFIAETDSF